MDLTNLVAYLDKGGMIVYILVAMNMLGFTVMIWKLIVIAISKANKKSIIEKTLIFVNHNNRHFDRETLKNALDYELHKIEYGLSSVKIIASISPLMGLLGTILGVAEAFEAISKGGLHDPQVFSHGISVALITTIVGLIVSIPHYIGYNYITGLIDTIEINLEREILEHI